MISRFSMLMLRRVIRWSALGTATAGGAWYAAEYRFKEELNSVGVVRFGRTALTAAAIAVDYKWTLFNLDPKSPSYDEIMSKVHLRSATRLKNVFCENRGVFIKVGQHIGALDYLLPAEYVRTMKSLHDKAPESRLEDLMKTVEQDLKCKASEIFRHIEPRPIGTASLAQCHKAELLDGTVVAVKIQHPSVRDNSHTDIRTMEFLVNCIAFIFPEFRFMWLAEETKKNLPIELDFANEGRNIEKVEKMLAKHRFVKVPKVFWKYTSDRILTMEFCEGTRVDDLEYIRKNKINVNKISERLGVIFSEMIFINGFVHCDPHPGNLIIKATGKNDFQISLIDHGLYQTLSKGFRYNYARIWMAMLENDIERLKELTKIFQIEDYYGIFACIVTGRSWDAIVEGIKQVKYSAKEEHDIRTNASNYLREISIVLNLVPREMLLLLKTNDLLRGLETVLNTRNSSSSFVHLTKCCIRHIHAYEREQLREQSRPRPAESAASPAPSSLSFLNSMVRSYLRELFGLSKVFSYEFILKLFNM